MSAGSIASRDDAESVTEAVEVHPTGTPVLEMALEKEFLLWV
jgi:hypothetical protein